MAERPEDLNLPSAVVCRIVKDALPPNTKVTKEAQAAIAKVILILCENQSKVILFKVHCKYHWNSIQIY